MLVRHHFRTSFKETVTFLSSRRLIPVTLKLFVFRVIPDEGSV